MHDALGIDLLSDPLELGKVISINILNWRRSESVVTSCRSYIGESGNKDKEYSRVDDLLRDVLARGERRV